MKRILLGTNWKMYKTVEETEAYIKELKYLADDYKQFQFFVIPPYTDLWHIKNQLENTSILYGAQNMHWEDEGPFTGEISPKMLKEIGINIAEIGHSERRQYYNENDYSVNNKVLAALKYDFIPLICVGENLLQKNYGVAEDVISCQLKIALNGVIKEDAVKIWIAYEPIWAIGTSGIPAEPSYASKIQTKMRMVLTELYGKEYANKIQILYGGSVNEENALSLIKQPNVDGLFIGRSAWKIETFRKICEQISKAN